jgi:hypothetical protein
MNLVLKKLKPDQSNLKDLYQQGFLPQKNDPYTFYQDSQNPSCRSNLINFSLSSENRRILKLSSQYSFHLLESKNLNYDFALQKKLKNWAKNMNWAISTSSIKTIFTNHLFNYFYLWTTQNQPSAYTALLKTPDFSQIAYVFYNPLNLELKNLPIRMVLQACIDAHQSKQSYCYLGTFGQRGYYKRNMPGFEYYQKRKWIPYEKNNS